MAETLLEKLTKERMHKQGCYELEHKCEMLYPSAVGTFLHSYNMECGSVLECKDFRRIDFTDFTPASARPLLLGLYGAESS